MSNDMPCAVDGCERPAKTRGWCKGHYQRIQRDGHPGSATFRRSPGKVPLKELARQSEPRKCKVPGCDGPARGRGWCNRHYQQWYRTGDPGDASPSTYGTADTCSVDSCKRPHASQGFCELHYRRHRRGLPTDSPEFLTQPTPMDDTSYHAVHRRITATRGPARQFTCKCGEPAEQWAYQHNDPEALTSPLGHPYSLRIFDCYAPMCLSCHGRLDKGMVRRARQQ